MGELTNETQAAFGQHITASLGVDLPEFWAILGEQAPWALEGYLQMRRGVFGRAEEGGKGDIPKQYLELIVVALDILQDNQWGLRVHTQAALDAGATPDEIIQVVVLTIMSAGMVSYRKTGYLVLEHLAEHAQAQTAL